MIIHLLGGMGIILILLFITGMGYRFGYSATPKDGEGFSPLYLLAQYLSQGLLSLLAFVTIKCFPEITQLAISSRIEIIVGIFVLYIAIFFMSISAGKRKRSIKWKAEKEAAEILARRQKRTRRRQTSKNLPRKG
jgi:hypothetical protein